MISQVFIASGNNLQESIQKLLGQFSLTELSGKRVALKANYNSADPFPASTNIDTLNYFIRELKSAGVSELTLAERSGMGDTRAVLEYTGVLTLAKHLQFGVEVLDDLPFSGWVHCDIDGSHWNRGFLLAKVFHEANAIVQTCCLKTHRFGGHFTLSLKNAVGMVAKQNPQDGYDYMSELHSSPHQRLMIAEINAVYEPSIILMDGIKAFVKGGPAHGDEVHPNVLLASADRVALDAVGVAILRSYRTTVEVARGKIFEQTQIARAADLQLGASSFDEIQLVSLDTESEDFCARFINFFDS